MEVGGWGFWLGLELGGPGRWCLKSKVLVQGVGFSVVFFFFAVCAVFGFKLGLQGLWGWGS